MERTREERLSIANEILRQLGGHKFVAMTGARDILALDSGVRFKLPGGGGFCKQGINRVEIELDPMDLYSVRFCKVQKVGRFDRQIKTVSEFDGIYFDQLPEIFTAETGLDTHL